MEIKKGRNDLANMSIKHSSKWRRTSIRLKKKKVKIPLCPRTVAICFWNKFFMSGQLFLLPIKSISDVTPKVFEFHQASTDKRIFHSIDFTHNVRACAFSFLSFGDTMRFVKHVSSSQSVWFVWKMTIEIYRRLINLLCTSTRRYESHFWLLCYFHQLFAVAVYRRVFVCWTIRNIHFWWSFLCENKWPIIDFTLFTPEAIQFYCLFSANKNAQSDGVDEDVVK